jgi:aspartate 1-decarboxylase
MDFSLLNVSGADFAPYNIDMNRFMLKSKIHRATVTDANVDYEGSLTVDADLLAAADILPFEEVHIWNVTRATRLRTYAIKGLAGSGVICANGAAAHLVKTGDRIIVATFSMMDDVQARMYQPRLVFVDEQNRIRPVEMEEVEAAVGELGRCAVLADFQEEPRTK